MTPERRASVSAGVLFIAGTATSLASSAVEHPVLTGTGYLTRITENTGRVSTGGLLELLAAGASAGIAVALYPVLRARSESLALGAVVFRALEAVMYAVGAVLTLSLLTVARYYEQASGPGRGALQQIGDALTGVRDAAILAGVFAYVLGALMYYCLLYRTRLLPRWLTGWGIAAEAPMLAACFAALFGHSPVTSFTLLIVPIAVQEMVLAAWLLAKGFAPRPATAGLTVTPGRG